MTAVAELDAPKKVTHRSGKVLVRTGDLSVRTFRRSILVCAGLLVALVVIAALTLTTGDFHIPVGEVIRALFGTGSPSSEFIVQDLRLPRLLVAILGGAALAVGGALFQSLSRNPLGSPDIVGFDAGAATGALVVVLVVHGSPAQTSFGALAGGVGTALAVYLLAMKKGASGYRLILVGIGVAAFLTAVNSYLITRANITDAQQAAIWMVGSLNGRAWSQVWPLAIAVVVLLPLALRVGRELGVLEMGEDTAKALGVRAESVRLLALFVGVGAAAMATAAAGPIGFIALSAPQIARRLTRSPGPNVLPAAFTGGVLLAASDLLAQRIFAPTQLPVGIATGVLGGLYLAWLLAGQWRKGMG